MRPSAPSPAAETWLELGREACLEAPADTNPARVDCFNRDGDYIGAHEYFFDDDGLLARIDYFDGPNEDRVTQSRALQRDDQRRVVGATVDTGTEIAVVFEFTYDETERLSTIVTTGLGGQHVDTTLGYDESGRLITQQDDAFPQPSNPNDEDELRTIFAWDELARPSTQLDSRLSDQTELQLERYFYAEELSRLPSRIESDFANDGTIDRTKLLLISNGGLVVRVDEDFDGDGQIDLRTDIKDDCCFCRD